MSLLSDIWAKSCEYIKEEIPNVSYNTWIKDVVPYKMTDDKIYLAVWNLGGDREFVIDTDCEIVEAKVGYPRNEKINCQINEKSLKIEFSENYQARIIEITI